MKRIICYLPIIFLLVCCSRNTSHNDSDKKRVLSLDFDYCAFKGNRIPGFKAITYVPLETKRECLISEISKLIYKKGIYYVFDRIQSSVFMFDKDGKYLQKIQKLGAGPGEYTDAFCFDIDAKQNIYIVSMAGKKIVKYKAPDYTSFKEMPVKESILEIAVDEKTGKIWVANAYTEKGVVCLGIYADTGIIPVLTNRGIFDSIESTLKVQSFYKSQDKLFFNPRFSPTIYAIDGAKAEPYMQMKAENMCNEKDIEAENQARKNPGQGKLSDKCLIYGVQSYYSVKDQYLMDIWDNNNLPILLKYDLENKNGELFCPLQGGPVKAYTKIMAVADNQFISYIDAGSFISSYNKTYINGKTIGEDNNPIIVLSGM